MNYFNSTLERRTGTCLDCKQEAYLTAQRCTFCYSTYRKKLMLQRQREKQKVRSLVNSKNNLEMAVKVGKAVDIELELWFKLQMNSNKKVCANCGKSLEHYSENDWRGSMHHIVDKSPINGCPSVASHPLNHLTLGKWCCHSQWHTSFLNASKMPIFPEAKRKFQVFKNLIPDSEMRKVNPYLLDTL